MIRVDHDRLREAVGRASESVENDFNPDTGNQKWWHGRASGVQTEGEAALSSIAGAVARGGGTIIRRLQPLAHEIADNLKDDLRVSRAAAARVGVGMLPQLYAQLDDCNERLGRWREIVAPGPDQLLKEKRSILLEMAMIERRIDAVLSGSAPLAGRVTKPKEDPESRDARAHRGMMQQMHLAYRNLNQKRAIAAGVIEDPIKKKPVPVEAVEDAEVIGDGAVTQAAEEETKTRSGTSTDHP